MATVVYSIHHGYYAAITELEVKAIVDCRENIVATLQNACRCCQCDTEGQKAGL